MDQAPVQIGQFILDKNLGIGAFGKVRSSDTYMWNESVRHGDPSINWLFLMLAGNDRLP